MNIPKVIILLLTSFEINVQSFAEINIFAELGTRENFRNILVQEQQYLEAKNLSLVTNFIY